MSQKRREPPRAVRNAAVITLRGPVTAAYRRSQGLWYCTALQFDIVGVGKTRDEAFGEMRDLFSDYVKEVLADSGPVRFFNPSEAQEWNVKKQETYSVTVVMARPEEQPSGRASLSDVGQLRPYRDAIQCIDLVPAGA